MQVTLENILFSDHFLALTVEIGKDELAHELRRLGQLSIEYLLDLVLGAMVTDPKDHQQGQQK